MRTALTNKDFSIEPACSQRCENNQVISGDVYIQHKINDRIILVLSDGAGFGIKANVTASIISSMAINYTVHGEPMERFSESIVKTFSENCDNPEYAHATFTILDIYPDGEVKIVEFDNPPYILIRKNEKIEIKRKEHKFEITPEITKSIFTSSFKAKVQDRLIIVSDGVTSSGQDTKRMPEGWDAESIYKFSKGLIDIEENISAKNLVNKIIEKAEENDLFTIKNDMSCVGVYFKNPRKILVCTGPPYDEDRDKELAEDVKNYKGEIIICGGTTAQIVSRELNRELNVVLGRDPSGLPPISKMEGIDMVTEGVLTLGKVKVMLESLSQSDIVTSKGTDAKIVKMLLDHDEIEFIVGTKINPIHQAPDLPAELELRRNVVKEIARLLENKFVKKVSIRYI